MPSIRLSSTRGYGVERTRLTVVGDIVVDTVELAAGERQQLGGSATYAALAASLQCDVHVVAAVGDDLRADTLEPLRRVEINLDDVRVLPGLTPTWQGTYDERARRRTIASHRGVAASFVPQLSDRALDAVALLVGTGDPFAQAAALTQWSGRGLTVADTIDHWIDDRRGEVRDVLRSADAACLGRREALALTGTADAHAAAAALRADAEQVVVLKDGERGSTLYRGDARLEVGAYPVASVVDPTGAGDAYDAAFLAVLASRPQAPTLDDFARAMLYAAATASFAIESEGVARLARATRAELEARATAIGPAQCFDAPHR